MNESDLSKQQKIGKDTEQADNGIGRVDRVHGGDLVELILPEDVKPMYDTKCKHTRTKLSDTTEFDELECEDCPMVWVYEYGTVRSNIKEA